MNTWRNTTRKLEEEIANAGGPPRGNQVPPLEEEFNDDQAPPNPSPLLTDGDIRDALLHMDQDITSQAHVVTTQAQDMTAQENLEVVPRTIQHVGTMASHLRDITRMNPSTFYRSMVEEDPKC